MARTGTNLGSESHETPVENPTWNYDEAFDRNRGLISEAEQDKLRQSRVAIAGMGGVGGIHAVTLARLGIGRFTIADPDSFEVANTNRQYGATYSNLGRSKVGVMADCLRDINPQAEVRIYDEFISRANASEFLQDANVFVDALDFFEFDIRRLMFRLAAERGISAITIAPIGFSAAWLVFEPGGMTFDEYFGLTDEMDLIDKVSAFAVGLAPKATHLSYMDLSRVKAGSKKGPSAGAACQLAAGVMGAEVVKMLLKRGRLCRAPHYQQFDPFTYRFARGRVAGGSRNPLQRVKRWYLSRRLRSAAHGADSRMSSNDAAD